jgi:hypothetical protein
MTLCELNKKLLLIPVKAVFFFTALSHFDNIIYFVPDPVLLYNYLYYLRAQCVLKNNLYI